MGNITVTHHSVALSSRDRDILNFKRSLTEVENTCHDAAASIHGVVVVGLPSSYEEPQLLIQLLVRDKAPRNDLSEIVKHGLVIVKALDSCGCSVRRPE